MKGLNMKYKSALLTTLAIVAITLPFLGDAASAYGTDQGIVPETSSPAPTESPAPSEAPTESSTPSPETTTYPDTTSPDTTPDPNQTPSSDPTPEPSVVPADPTPEPSQDNGGEVSGETGGGETFGGGSSGGNQASPEPDPTPKPWYVDPGRASSRPEGTLGNYAIISEGKTINVIVLDPSDAGCCGGGSWVDWFNSENGRNVYGEGAVLVKVGEGDWTQPGHETVIGDPPTTQE